MQSLQITSPKIIIGFYNLHKITFPSKSMIAQHSNTVLKNCGTDEDRSCSFLDYPHQSGWGRNSLPSVNVHKLWWTNLSKFVDLSLITPNRKNKMLVTIFHTLQSPASFLGVLLNRSVRFLHSEGSRSDYVRTAGQALHNHSGLSSSSKGLANPRYVY